MDKRKNQIKELEAMKLADGKARNQLLEELGEVLFQRIGEGTPFTGEGDDTPGGVLSEYRKLQKDVAESEDIIKSLEKEVVKLKELEEAIASKEEEKSRSEKELTELNTGLGKALFENPDFHSATGASREQEADLLSKIGDQEGKLEELEKKEGGLFTWLGKNFQITMSKTLLSKNRTALNQLYHDTGEKYLSALAEGAPFEGAPIEESAETIQNALRLKESLSSLATDLAALRGERRKSGELFGAEGSPSRRIEGLQKHIAHVKGEFPALHRRMGSFAVDNETKEGFSSLIKKKDAAVLEKAGALLSQIAEKELGIKKLHAAINIDAEKAEVQKLNKAIIVQKQKSTAAAEAINGLENQITGIESKIAELNKFIEDNGGIQEDHGSEDQG